MTRKLIDTDIKLGEGTLTKEAVEDVLVDLIEDYDVDRNGYVKLNKSGLILIWGRENVLPNKDIIIPFPIIPTMVLNSQVSVNRSGGYNNLLVQGKGIANNNQGIIVYTWASAGSTPSHISVEYTVIATYR